MPDERKINGWNVETLREFIITLMDERDKRYEQRFELQDQSVKNALDAKIAETNKAMSIVGLIVGVIVSAGTIGATIVVELLIRR